MQKKVRVLQKSKVLGVGLQETQKMLKKSSAVFILNDKDHEEVNR